MRVSLGMLLLWPALAWSFGADGHRIIGQIAVDQLSRPVAIKVVQLLDGQPLAEACNWPDEVRGQPGFESTAPLHYVNLPPRQLDYDAQRDCGNGNCLVAAINRFYGELANHSLSKTRRAEALKFLCHFVGDLHQPLHTGYAHDRGGNDFDVRWRDEKPATLSSADPGLSDSNLGNQRSGNLHSTNLHSVWDVTLVERSGPWRAQARVLGQHCRTPALSPQIKSVAAKQIEVRQLVLSSFAESRRLVLETVYPPSHQLDSAYLSRHTKTAAQRVCAAGCRLASLLEQALR